METATPIGDDPAGLRVSYAQNGEDVRLWRAFRDVDVGFYVEVGGWDPEEHSITRSFYGRGWAGVVVEPVAAHADAFRSRRPRDRVLEMLAGAEDEVRALHTFEGTGLSTTSDEHALRHEAAGFSSRVDMIPMRRLSPVLDEIDVPEIHFMVIDTEGAEADVLAGLDLQRHRPWVLVVESTLPLSQEQSHGLWEHSVTAAGYEMVAFDGLNRFYVAQEHAELGALVAMAPNVFDDYLTSGVVQLQHARDEANRAHAAALEERDDANRALVAELTRSDLLRARLDAARANLDELVELVAERDAQVVKLTGEVGDLRSQVAQLNAQLSGVLSSRSWKLTKPLRSALGRGA